MTKCQIWHFAITQYTVHPRSVHYAGSAGFFQAVVFKRLMENEHVVKFFIGTEPEERKLIEIEQEAWRTINAQVADEVEKDKVIEEKDKEIEALKRWLNIK